MFLNSLQDYSLQDYSPLSFHEIIDVGCWVWPTAILVWSLDASKTGESTKYLLVTPPPLPTGTLYSPQFCLYQGTKMVARRTQRSILYSPQFCLYQGPRWWPVELNDQYLWSHGKIGDCEQCNWKGFIKYIWDNHLFDSYCVKLSHLQS